MSNPSIRGMHITELLSLFLFRCISGWGLYIALGKKVQILTGGAMFVLMLVAAIAAASIMVVKWLLFPLDLGDIHLTMIEKIQMYGGNILIILLFCTEVGLLSQSLFSVPTDTLMFLQTVFILWIFQWVGILALYITLPQSIKAEW